MDNSGGIQASLAGRYATALFALAQEGKAVPAVEKSLLALESAVAGSDDFKRLIASPLVSRASAEAAAKALTKSLKLDTLTGNFLGVLAANRRLPQIAPVIAAFRGLAAGHRGETSAEVTSAHPLSAAQVTALKAKLKAKIGSDVAVSLKTDPDILGGLIVKIGSQMIDSSIKTRLNTLATAMKG